MRDIYFFAADYALDVRYPQYWFMDVFLRAGFPRIDHPAALAESKIQNFQTPQDGVE